MTFTEAYEEMLESEKQLNIAIMKADIFTEASYKNLEINRQEADLKVLTESGTYDDLNYLYEAASEGFVNKVKKAVEKIADSLVEFINKIVTKVKSVFGTERAKKTLDAVEKAANSNSKVKNKKITIKDGSKAEKEIQKEIDGLRGKLSRFKAGRVSKADIKSVDETVSRINKKKVAIITATTAITVGAAIVLLRKLVSETDSNKGAAIKDAKNIATQIKMEGVDTSDEDILKATQKLHSGIATLVKDKLKCRFEYMGSIISGLRGKSSGPLPSAAEALDKRREMINKTKDQIKLDRESGVNIRESVDEEVEALESADEDNDQIYMNNLYDEVFGESVEEFDESFDEDDFIEGYQEMLESVEESDEFSEEDDFMEGYQEMLESDEEFDESFEEDDFMEGYQEMLESTDDSFESMTSEFEERMNNLLED